MNENNKKIVIGFVDEFTHIFLHYFENNNINKKEIVDILVSSFISSIFNVIHIIDSGKVESFLVLPDGEKILNDAKITFFSLYEDWDIYVKGAEKRETS